MIDKIKIHEIGKQIGVTSWQAEKDYLQHLFLRDLYSHINQELVFKGGTCLQKAYGLHRFSRDLDFNINGEINLKTMLEKISKELATIGLLNNISKTEENKYAANFLMKFDSTEMKNSLTIQMSKREICELQPRQIAITPLYSDISPYFVFCMDEQEIAAEKIRAIYQRAFPRDVYDLWFLIKRGTKLDMLLIQKKLATIKQTYDKTKCIGHIRAISKNWDELKDLLFAYPKFEEVIQEIQEKLST